VSQQALGESTVPGARRKPWTERALEALLVVSFFLMGFFGASRDAAAGQDGTERHKNWAPVGHISVRIEAS
jgi:hypothetical protein